MIKYEEKRNIKWVGLFFILMGLLALILSLPTFLKAQELPEFYFSIEYRDSQWEDLLRRTELFKGDSLNLSLTAHNNNLSQSILCILEIYFETVDKTKVDWTLFGGWEIVPTGQPPRQFEMVIDYTTATWDEYIWKALEVPIYYFTEDFQGEFHLYWEIHETGDSGTMDLPLFIHECY